MGCCVSTSDKSKRNVGSESESLQHQKQKAPSFSESRAPPPSAEEETVVKEVVLSVSEAPKHKPQQQQVSISETLKPKPILESELEDEKTQKAPVFEKIKDTHHLLYNRSSSSSSSSNNNNNNNNNKVDLKAQHFLITNKSCTTPKDDVSVSEVSEICSESLSVSTTTTTTTRDNIEFEEVRQRQRGVSSRSPAKLQPGSRNRVGVGKSPTRRSDQSPVKRNGFGHNPGMVRRAGPRPESNRRDQGESSGRRSRSPATNRSMVMGRSRSPSVKRNSKSPGRVRPCPADSMKLEESCGNNMECKWPPSNDNNGVSDDANGSSTNESLENPLVSLECFIFL